MNKVRSLIFLVAIVFSASASAVDPKQTFEEYKKQKIEEFNKYREQKQTEFEQNRQRLNEEFAARISAEWKQYKTEPKKTLPATPKPPQPTVVDNRKPTAPVKVPVSTVVPPEKKIPDVPVTIPKIDRTIPQKRYPVNFTFYNTPCGIGQFDTSLLSFSSTSPSEISKAWGNLTANGNLEPLLADCLRLREEMQLCDYGFLQLVDTIGGTLYPGSPNKQAFLAAALMMQAGYDCRLMKKDDRLVVGYHPSHTIYGEAPYSFNGKSYHLFGPLARQEGQAMSYPGDFMKSPTPIRMTVERYPRFADPKSGSRKYSSSSWTSAPPFELTVNKSAMDFFDSYPIVEWPLYGLTPLSPEVERTLFPVMEILTEGMGEEEAVNTILSYMNYGFKYMTDDDQFSREKPFFPDENFYYPYNDCEDRAILFSKIVKRILGLDAVYLFYPGHLAAAVRFSPEVNVKGASTVVVDGVPYVVCDPTCIGGKAGYLHPHYAKQEVKVYKVRL